MGYTTTFKGVLEFTRELKATELAYLKQFLGQDCRDHKNWPDNAYLKKLYYSIDLELNKDFSGLVWTGIEKSYEMESQVNYLIFVMKTKFLDFGLKGKLVCQGEDVEDRWELVIKDGLAVKQDIAIVGKKLECPNCGESFILEDK